MSDPPNVAAIFVTHNSAATIGDAIASVAGALRNLEIVVVDNASADTSREIVASSGAKLIARDRNDGFGRACNAGAEQAAGRHLFFLNPDVRIASADLDALERLLGREPFGLVSATFVLPDGRRYDGLRSETGLVREVASHTLGVLRPRGLPPGPPRSDGDRRWIGGAAFLAKRDEFLRLGGFDPRFFLYHEDRELSARYRSAGLPLSSTAALVVAHRGGASSDDDDLRVEPAAWELLSWLEYVHRRHGSVAARRAASITWLTLGVFASVLSRSPARGPGGPRRHRKARQIARILDRLPTIADEAAAADFVPNAVGLVRRRTS